MVSLGMPRGWDGPIAEYTSWLQAAGIPETTRKLRSYHLRRFGFDSGRTPFDVALGDLVTHVGSRKWSPNYRRSVRATLRSFYGWATQVGRCGSNPAELLPSVTAPIGRPRPAPEKAVEVGLAAVDERVRLMVMLAAQSGLRCREIALVHSLDLEEDLIGWTLRVHGKGNKVRLVPLIDTLARKLRDQPDGYVFPGNDAGHLSSAYVSKLISRALPEGITAHTLRHRFASRAFAADRDIRAVQELLGHSSVATTQIYTAVPDGALRRAVTAAA